ncbi:MAG: hypothetical protein J5814_02805 [Bacteroidaceae bacterium]|nr:hypothetical protein [Bacteroidaceae bacterium]
MGVCVEGLIRNDFYDFDNIEVVEAELNRASKCLNDYFHLEGEDVYYPEGLDCNDYQVYSDTHHMFRMILKKGYWHVSPAYRYHQLFSPPLFVRKGFYDVAKALGKKEIWYCDEFRLDNSGDKNWDYDTQSFEEWLDYIHSTYGIIKEFPVDEIMSFKEMWFPADPVYHDSFMDLE